MKEILHKTAVFCLIVFGIYILLILAAANLETVGRTLNSKTFHTNFRTVSPGDNSFMRMKEISNYRNVDILFVGSSHCYRSFDPRFYQARGLNVFNMGSTSQSPVNSYFLLKKYLPDLNPGLVVIEVYWEVMEENGLESALDLLSNAEMSPQLIEMALAVGDFRAVNALLIRLLNPNYDLTGITPEIDEKDSYIEGGFVERISAKKSYINKSPAKSKFNAKQIYFLEKTIELLQERHCTVLLASQPVPEETIEWCSNYKEAAGVLKNIAKAHNISYIDYNSKVRLDREKYYYDSHHLNQRGAEIFNSVFWEDAKYYFQFANSK